MLKYEKEIRNSVLLNSKKLGIKEDIRTIKVSKLGVGENNLSMLAVINGRYKMVFRIALRPNIEKNMKREFETLKRIPKGFGPEPLLLDRSKKTLPRVYSILSYIEGKHVKRWKAQHLKMHARKLARLHRHTRPYWGTMLKREKSRTPLTTFQDNIREYRRCPGVIDDEVKQFMPKLRKYFRENEKIFTHRKRFSLVHSDVCIVNILFTKQGIRYIDWEWSGFKDNALDVVMLYDPDVAQPPWKLKLGGKTKELYLKEYLKHNPDRTLRQRVEIWAALYRFTDLLFFKWKLQHWDKEESKDIPKSHYKRLGQLMAKSLRKMLGE